MEKNQIWKDFIIKFLAACLALICIVFLVGNMLSMFPLFRSLSLSESEIWNYIYQTRLGTLYNSMIVTDDTAILKMAEQGILSFLMNLQWYVLLFLCFVLFLLIFHFINPEDQLVRSYLKVQRFIILFYLLKYVFIVLGIAIFFRNSIRGVSIGLVFDTAFSTVFDLLLIGSFSLFIIKFVLNFMPDLKEMKATLHKM